MEYKNQLLNKISEKGIVENIINNVSEMRMYELSDRYFIDRRYKVLHKLPRNFCYDEIIKEYLLSEKILVENIDKFNFSDITLNQKLTYNVLNAMKNSKKQEINWIHISNKKLSLRFIIENMNKLNIVNVLVKNQLPEKILNNIKGNPEWSAISLYQDFSIEFYKKHKNKFNRHLLSMNFMLNSKTKYYIM